MYGTIYENGGKHTCLVLLYIVMSWICGYMFVAALLTSTMTVVYTMTEYIIGKRMKRYRHDP